MDTVKELATRRPDNLHAKCLTVCDKKNVVRRPPSVGEVERWVAHAKKLKPAVSYRWAARLATRPGAGPYSADVNTTTNMDFEGLVNARDLGGVPLAGGGMVRAGVLYRSETPELMTDADVELALGQLGLVRIVDLRGHRARPYPLGAGGRTRVIDFFHLAGGHELVDGTEHGFLPSLLARGGVAVGRFLELMVEVDGPTLVHCHTGKDRTGFVAAMVLALVGAADDEIVADYSRSVPVYGTMLANLNAVGLGVPASAPPYARSAPSPEGMRTMLGRLREGWPSPRHYLLEQGVDAAVLDESTARLTAPRAGAGRPT